MPNQSGTLYGLTILSPIKSDDTVTPSHDLQIREYLATLATGQCSPFAKAPFTHITRLVVMDDVIYVGMPSCEEHLKFKYLVWESNFDCGLGGDLDTYLTALATAVPDELDAIWNHCIGYPGARNVPAFIAYMKACQIETSFYFAAVNDKTVTESLKALQTQRAVADFIATHQGLPPERLQRDFIAFAAKLKAAPVPGPAAMAEHPAVCRVIKMGGHNE